MKDSVVKLIIISLAMLIIWGSLITFWYLKTDEITKDPCTICAEKQGDLVQCWTGQIYPTQKVFYPNGTITVNAQKASS